ncbi:aminoglycoside phosphotransferase family protein [Neobacillus drentensis]|uniref:aminoglycoside phosphotransferase family protein n=1 Tax=Bacillaceae TaxID=186817 RepID=UPI000BFC5916|nr:aminoglycoside phosphotransferase family protein [Bacillus sp. AFS031507]PGY12040.1 phosphotransferase [Bacillus sp. AFS031507]
MTISKDTPEINPSLVKRLVSEQFPQWADLPLEPFNSTGTENAIYRLGKDMFVRLPLGNWAIKQVEKEQQWLPILAPHLPLTIPTLLALGLPAEGYPWRWSVYRWIKGENAITGKIDIPYEAATELAHFVSALQRINPAGGPPPGDHNFGRGLPLAMRDVGVREAIEKLHNSIDTDSATLAWDAALQTPVWDKPPVWIHGDLLSGNLLVEQGRLSAVIDFGGLGVGDPANDWMFAWNLLSVDDRERLRVAFAVDDATWGRARGWALSVGLIALPYYQISNPVFASVARRLIDEALCDFKEGV